MRRKRQQVPGLISASVEETVPMAKVVTHSEFNRPIREAHVAHLVRNWVKEAGLETVVLCTLEDDPTTYRVLLGQHRIEAARRLGVTELTCRVRHGISFEQAAWFVGLDADNRRQTPQERFDIDLAAGLPEAVGVRKAAKFYGFEVGQSPGQLRCVAAARKVYRMGVLGNVLYVVSRAWSGSQLEAALEATMVEGLGQFISRARQDDPREPDLDRLAKKLSWKSPTYWLSEARKFSTNHASHMAKDVVRVRYLSGSRKSHGEDGR